jgi:hypothetical protein
VPLEIAFLTSRFTDKLLNPKRFFVINIIIMRYKILRAVERVALKLSKKAKTDADILQHILAPTLATFPE